MSGLSPTVMPEDIRHQPPKGRGASKNPANRFEQIHLAELDENFDEPRPDPRTRYLHDRSRSIISFNDSPDVGFSAGINPYRGCEHGCIYCYARPTHEYLGFSSGLDFETQILVKEDAPKLLRQTLSNPRWQPQVLALSGNTDCYQPVEKKLQITRRCLEVLAEFGNPVAIITKNRLITRDIDFLQKLAAIQAVNVYISVTSLDTGLCSRMEPRTSRPPQRLEAIRQLKESGIPVGVLVAPVIPGLNDHEIPSILQAAAEAGAMYAGYVMLRLPYGVKDLFVQWLKEHEPLKAEKILNRIRSVRGGKLNEASFGKRMSGAGIFADSVKSLFTVARRRYGLNSLAPELSVHHFHRAPSDQMELFENRRETQELS